MSILKKFALLMTICAVIGLSNFNIACAYPDFVAVISNYSKVKNRIAIQRANGPTGGSQALLYPGDTITGDVGDIEIERGPHADFHAVDGTYYLITYDPPTGFIEGLREHIKIFFNNTYRILIANNEPVDDYIVALTRGPSDSNLETSYGMDLNPRPGFNATLLKNQKVCFAGVSQVDNYGKATAPKNYVVKDGNGQEIYSGLFDKNGEVELDLS